jgi:peptidoglycan-associated lipoprotein
MKTSSLLYSVLVLGVLAGCACPPKSAAPMAATEQPAAAAPAPEPKAVVGAPKGSVYFDYDKSDIKAKYQPVVEAYAKYLKANPGASVTVQGNTDERGSSEYNLGLGQRRADAVKNALLLLGVKDSQVESVSFGEEKPRATGTDEASYAENRRSDVVYK